MNAAPITPCLWFDGCAEEAARFYVGLLPGSGIDAVIPAPATNPSTPEGAVLLVRFHLGDRPFIALNGGPRFSFTEAISFQIEVPGQAEVDRLWEGLVAGGGEHSACGWLKDRFGLSWQVIPAGMGDLIAGPDADGARRAMTAMLEMSRIDLAALARAYAGDPEPPAA